MPYQLPRSESVLTACELLTLQQNNHAKVHSFLTHHAVSSSSTVCKPWQKSFVYTTPLYCVARIQLWGWQRVNGNFFIDVGDCSFATRLTLTESKQKILKEHHFDHFQMPLLLHILNLRGLQY